MQRTRSPPPPTRRTDSWCSRARRCVCSRTSTQPRTRHCRSLVCARNPQRFEMPKWIELGGALVRLGPQGAREREPARNAAGIEPATPVHLRAYAQLMDRALSYPPIEASFGAPRRQLSPQIAPVGNWVQLPGRDAMPGQAARRSPQGSSAMRSTTPYSPHEEVQRFNILVSLSSPPDPSRGALPIP